MNEFRFAFIQWNINTTHVDGGQNRSEALGIPNANRGDAYSSGLSLIFMSGFGYGGSMGDSQYVPEIAHDNTYGFSDALSWVHGHHTMKFGADVRRWTRNFFQAQAPFGLFDFGGFFTSQLTTNSGGNAIADMLLGLPIYSQQDSLAQMDYTTNTGNQASMRRTIGRCPTISRSTSACATRSSRPWAAVSAISISRRPSCSITSAPTPSANAGVKYDLHDFGPRLGFAWSPFGNRTVIRAAGGVFYAPEGNIFNDLGENPPTLEFYSSQANPLAIPTAASLISAGFPASLPPINPLNPSGEVKTTGPRRLMPRIYEWNFDVQHQLTGSMMLDVAYVGTRALRLWDNEASNLDQPVQPLDSNFGPAPNYGRPYYSVQPNLSLIYPIDLPHFDSFYNGLEVKFEKRFSNGLTFRTAYTWSKDLGTGQGTPGGAIQNSADASAGRGYVEPDFRHRFVASWVYQLPFGRGKMFGNNWNRATDLILGGWDLNGIATCPHGRGHHRDL